MKYKFPQDRSTIYIYWASKRTKIPLVTINKKNSDPIAKQSPTVIHSHLFTLSTIGLTKEYHANTASNLASTFTTLQLSLLRARACENFRDPN